MGIGCVGDSDSEGWEETLLLSIEPSTSSTTTVSPVMVSRVEGREES